MLRVQNLTSTLHHLKGLFLEEDCVVDPRIHQVAQSWRLEDLKIEHIVHTYDIVVSIGLRPMSLFNPEEVPIWELLAHHKLDTLHIFELIF